MSCKQLGPAKCHCKNWCWWCDILLCPAGKTSRWYASYGRFGSAMAPIIFFSVSSSLAEIGILTHFPFLRPRVMSRINSVRLPSLSWIWPWRFRCWIYIPIVLLHKVFIPHQLQCPEVLLCLGVNGFQCPSGYGGAKQCLGEGNKGHCDLEMPMWLGWRAMGVKLVCFSWVIFGMALIFWKKKLQCFGAKLQFWSRGCRVWEIRLKFSGCFFRPLLGKQELREEWSSQLLTWLWSDASAVRATPQIWGTWRLRVAWNHKSLQHLHRKGPWAETFCSPEVFLCRLRVCIVCGSEKTVLFEVGIHFQEILGRAAAQRMQVAGQRLLGNFQSRSWGIHPQVWRLAATVGRWHVCAPKSMQPLVYLSACNAAWCQQHLNFHGGMLCVEGSNLEKLISLSVTLNRATESLLHMPPVTFSKGTADTEAMASVARMLVSTSGAGWVALAVTPRALTTAARHVALELVQTTSALA